jgi:glycosyltransferase involved in cell wall biosynthesis
MKIAILGTRGIPNRYGGFERFAEKLSQYLTDQGHKVIVYNPDIHPYEKDVWKGVKIRKVFSKENRLGFLGNIIFDYLSLRDALKDSYDIILELGYSPASLFYFLKSKSKSVLITNMDGLEWKREKWNRIAKIVLKFSEKLAVKKSDALVADNKEIKKYIHGKYNKNSYYIPYGADLFETPDETVLKKFGLYKYKYFLVIARFEPENNISEILAGYIESKTDLPLILIGNYKNKTGEKILKEYDGYKNTKFLGGIYDKNILDNLRYFSRIYFHGHSVGGTNPSLLEAMAAGSFIAAHNNMFNISVLGEDALYFNDSNDIKKIILNENTINKKTIINNNKQKIAKYYSWDSISEQYLNLFNIVRSKKIF